MKQTILSMDRERRYRDKRKPRFRYTITAARKIPTKYFKAIMAYIQKL